MKEIALKINVYYPSGSHFTCSGVWQGPGNVGGANIILIVLDEDLRIPGSKIVEKRGNAIMDGGQLLEKGGLLMGDPRGVYQDKNSGKVLYNPRDAMVDMDKVWLDWLKEHPEWPGVLELSV